MDGYSESCEYWFESRGCHGLNTLSGSEHLVVTFVALSVGDADSDVRHEVQSFTENEGITVSYSDTDIFIS